MSENKVENAGTGILSKNDYKQQPNHPDKRGRCKIKGLWFWVSAWSKTGSAGDFDSMSFTEMSAEDAAKYEAKEQARLNPTPQSGSGFSQPTQQQAQPQSQPQQQAQQPQQQPPMDFDDDIPF